MEKTIVPSATQWTSATDMNNRIIYFRTMYNSTIRSIDLRSIDFSKVHYRAVPMDTVRQQPIEKIKIMSEELYYFSDLLGTKSPFNRPFIKV